MATPKRSGLSRGDSPFALLIREVLAQLQTGANPDALAFGFPSDRAMRLGERLGVFCAVDDWYELSFSAQPGGAFDQAPDIVHAIDPFHAKLIDRLWLSMSREFIDFPVGVRVRFGYNYRMHREMTVQGYSSLAGFTFGVGLKVSRFRIGGRCTQGRRMHCCSRYRTRLYRHCPKPGLLGSQCV